MKKIFSELNPEELQELDTLLKKVGKHAEGLGSVACDLDETRR
jgi:hypothetical protein